MRSFQDRLAALERNALACLLASETPAVLLADLTPEHFGHPDHRKILERLQAIYRERGRLDALTVAVDPDLPREAMNDITALQGDLRPEAVVVDDLRAARVAREARALLSRADVGLQRTDFVPKDVAEALGVLAQRIHEAVARTAAPETAENLMPAAQEILTDLRERIAEPGLKTGIPILDRRLGDGMQPGTLTLVLGRSGHGKSCFGVTAALKAARRGKRVLYASREMLAKELLLRFVAAELRTPLPEVKQRLRDKDQTVEAALWRVARMSLEVEDQESDIERIAARVEREHLAGKGYALVVLDFLQLFRGPGDEAHQQLENVAYIAKALALRTGCVVLAPVQPNRVGSKEKGCPTMSDIRGSSGIENAADAIISIERLGSQNRELSPGEPFELDVVLEKSRNGQPGPMSGRFRLGAGTFLVWEEECGQEVLG